MSARKNTLPPPMAPSKAQEEAMKQMMGLIQGGFSREGELHQKDAAGTAQPPAVRKGQVKVQVPMEPKTLELHVEHQVPMEPKIPERHVEHRTPVEPEAPRHPEPPDALSYSVTTRPKIGLDDTPKRNLEMPKSRKMGMSTDGSGWGKCGWFMQDSTRQAAALEISRLNTTGSEYLDNALRYYTSSLQLLGNDPELLLDDAVYMLKDILRYGLTDELRARMEEFIAKI